MALERKEVEEIALLARIALAPDEIERMQSELGAILEHFSAIAQVDTTDVPPMTHAVPKDMLLREDEPAPSMPANEALFGAPKREGDLFVVPAIIPGGES
ncbi:MAG: Asp-tRNA(Asn)/Glu-tRNA(Gln) amidotransferase subunit GatC [Myxococcota bacterium]|nr:Asp-tRNA(Asn)/Glu-tRNA(Gln) amidotransferase subunit GatC [Deltaproteobacteria bacterium]MDQ3341402.1 Asp-tRNA(Asn)/Glu-tRNA(Gln) amidotransferase subunit GatC [Myxococcota bacterium]